MTLSTLAAPLCATLLAAFTLAPAASDTVEVYWPDGSVRAKYGIDDQGRRQGPYLEYREDGSLSVKARYVADRLDGRYESFWPGGERELRTSYKGGLLHGKHETWDAEGRPLLRGKYLDGERDGEFEWFRAGAPVSAQRWKAGELIELEGLAPYPRPLAELRATLVEVYDPERTSTTAAGKPPGFSIDADGDLSAAERAAQDVERDAALRRLMAYRSLVGLPWSDMRLDHEYNHFCSMAARLLVKVGKLDHTPANPGIPDDEYRAGYQGTSSSNLAVGSNLPGSIDSYMDDSDESNIDRVGHRLWCLNPRMLRTGFGRRGSFSAMWSFDQGRGKVPSYDAIRYPAAGWFPCEYFGPRHAWTVQLGPGGTWPNDLGAIAVRVYPLDAEHVRADAPLELDHLGTRDTALIFRPVGVVVQPGQAYWVEIDGVRGSKFKGGLRYLVEFTSEAEAPDGE
ncbi:MAG: hypothetical protein H6828_08415 [Planctomycetes bacterium]|nr:hypothetical protein [Planctomycetota bacterium]